MEEKILNIFRSKAHEFVSGEMLSEQLGVSRTAIWKHIEKLREYGYVIDAQPHLGYRLTNIPDRLLSSELSWQLNTDIVGKEILSFDVVSSTMDVALELAEKGVVEGTCIFSEGQKKGRGRLGRMWHSPKFKSIYCSVILRPNILPSESPKITLTAAVAAARAIREISSLGALIKWPNDILINNKKVCGILTEMNAETDKVKFLIVGIGMNVNGSTKNFPRGASTLQAEAGFRLSRIEVARSLLRNLDEQYRIFKKQGFKKIISEWESLSATLGTRVKVASRDRNIEGQAIDVDKDGALVVRLDNGFSERILTGDVVMVR